MSDRTITTTRLRLEPWDDSHTALLISLSAMPRVTRHIAAGEVWPRARAEEVAAAQRDHWARHGFGWRAAIDRASARPLGLVALSFAGAGTAGLSADEYEIGWWLHPDAWGRGLSREGAAAIRDEAFADLHAPSIVARIQPANAPSIGVATAIGMAFEFETTGRTGEALGVYRLTRPARPRSRDA